MLPRLVALVHALDDALPAEGPRHRYGGTDTAFVRSVLLPAMGRLAGDVQHAEAARTDGAKADNAACRKHLQREHLLQRLRRGRVAANLPDVVEAMCRRRG